MNDEITDYSFTSSFVVSHIKIMIGTKSICRIFFRQQMACLTLVETAQVALGHVPCLPATL